MPSTNFCAHTYSLTSSLHTLCRCLLCWKRRRVGHRRWDRSFLCVLFLSFKLIVVAVSGEIGLSYPMRECPKCFGSGHGKPPGHMGRCRIRLKQKAPKPMGSFHASRAESERSATQFSGGRGRLPKNFTEKLIVRSAKATAHENAPHVPSVSKKSSSSKQSPKENASHNSSTTTTYTLKE